MVKSSVTKETALDIKRGVLLITRVPQGRRMIGVRLPYVLASAMKLNSLVF